MELGQESQRRLPPTHVLSLVPLALASASAGFPGAWGGRSQQDPLAPPESLSVLTPCSMAAVH